MTTTTARPDTTKAALLAKARDWARLDRAEQDPGTGYAQPENTELADLLDALATAVEANPVDLAAAVTEARAADLAAVEAIRHNHRASDFGSGWWASMVDDATAAIRSLGDAPAVTPAGDGPASQPEAGAGIDAGVVALLKYPVPLDQLGIVVKLVKRIYGGELIVNTQDPHAAHGWMVFARDEPADAR